MCKWNTKNQFPVFGAIYNSVCQCACHIDKIQNVTTHNFFSHLTLHCAKPHTTEDVHRRMALAVAEEDEASAWFSVPAGTMPWPFPRMLSEPAGLCAGAGRELQHPSAHRQGTKQSSPTSCCVFSSTQGRSPSGRPLFWIITQFLNSSACRYAS